MLISIDEILSDAYAPVATERKKIGSTSYGVPSGLDQYGEDPS
jgi:hypothetical protein